MKKRMQRREKVYVVHEHERGEGSSLLFASISETRAHDFAAKQRAQINPDNDVDVVQVDELDLEDE